ncbi:MAG: phosphate ABC transporter, permease protein PstA, partial [Actinobacteria bacterium]|nr:phosphate ABC transporter, permease protein PstA [Actinomycetota bacterium]
IGLPEAIQRSWTGILILLIVVLILFATARYLGSKNRRKP